MRAKEFLLGILVGGIVGGVIAILLAPQGGADTRRGIAAAADSAQRKAQDLASGVGEKVRYGSDKIRQAI